MIDKYQEVKIMKNKRKFWIAVMAIALTAMMVIPSVATIILYMSGN